MYVARLGCKSRKSYALGAPVSGLGAQISDFRPRIGIPEDWTHHHVRFSSATIRQHPESASREPRAALHLYREAFMAALKSRRRDSTEAGAPINKTFATGC